VQKNVTFTNKIDEQNYRISMRIVVTDGYTLNPGDLDWSPIEKLGETTIYERSTSEQLVERCKEAEIVLTNKARFTAEVINQLPKLKYIGLMATGYDNIDLQAARKQGIVVSNVKDYGSHAVAQHTFALILELTNHVGLHSASVQQSEWSSQPDFCYWKSPIQELFSKTIGIVGFGKIGSKVARIAKGFGMHVIAYHKHPEKDFQEDVHFVTLEKLLEDSDIISLHCPLKENNREMINATSLTKLKPSALLINTSRGALVNEQDLAKALNEEKIAGAALDVLCQEPPDKDNPLFSAKNCLITPHNAWASQESRQRLMQILTENLQNFLEGRPSNVIHA
jgi:glycerate dehydrogenase